MIWRMWAHVYPNGDLWNLWPDRRSVQSYGLPYEQVEVDMRVVEHDDAEGTHWGWVRTGETVPRMIYPRRGLLDMCFPYGAGREEKAGRGTVVHLAVKRA